MLALEIALFTLALPVVAAAGYLLVLALAARAAPDRAPAGDPPPRLRFDIVVDGGR